MKLIILCLLMIMLGCWLGFIICAVLSIDRRNEEKQNHPTDDDVYEAFRQGKIDILRKLLSRDWWNDNQRAIMTDWLRQEEEK